MGWGYCGTDDLGRQIGYSIPAKCDHPGCNESIDRGLAYVCGGMHGGSDGVGCGRYFCTLHMQGHDLDDAGNYRQMCGHCGDLDESVLMRDEIDRLVNINEAIAAIVESYPEEFRVEFQIKLEEELEQRKNNGES